MFLTDLFQQGAGQTTQSRPRVVTMKGRARFLGAHQGITNDDGAIRGQGHGFNLNGKKVNFAGMPRLAMENTTLIHAASSGADVVLRLGQQFRQFKT